MGVVLWQVFIVSRDVHLYNWSSQTWCDLVGVVYRSVVGVIYEGVVCSTAGHCQWHLAMASRLENIT